MATYADQFSSSPYYALALQYANQRGINPQFFTTQIAQESGFNPGAQNGDATGIAQFVPSTALQYGIDPSNPDQSLYAASAYDSDLLQQCGGDYVCVAQNYGTLPKSGNYSTGQQAVYDAAIAANTGSGYKTSYWAELACSVGFSSQCNGTSQDETKMLAQQIGLQTDANGNPVMSGSQTKCGSLDLICGIKQSGANILGIVAGLILLVVGLVMLRTGDDITRVPSHVSYLAKKTFKLNGAEVAALAAT